MAISASAFGLLFFWHTGLRSFISKKYAIWGKKNFLTDLSPDQSPKHEDSYRVPRQNPRDSSSVLTVFIQEDPRRDGMHWYGFVGGDPVNKSDPSGFFEFVNAEPEWFEQPGYPYPRRVRNTSDAYFTAGALVAEYQDAQNHLVDMIENDPFSKLNSCSPKQQKILDELVKQFKSDRKVLVYGQRDFLSNLVKGSQGRVFIWGMQLFPEAPTGGQRATEVLFHEAIHILQYDGVLPREYWETAPTTDRASEIIFRNAEPDLKVYEQQYWFFGQLGIPK
ncbi:MAG: hypothetical protein H3C47_15885 [Candidatus Cloacimonetes bacterium]|nr:hypothetical protein [Candidatus Cloacimonadota bacterium]